MAGIRLSDEPETSRYTDFTNIYFTMIIPLSPQYHFVLFCKFGICLVIHLDISDFSADLQFLLNWILGPVSRPAPWNNWNTDAK